MSTVTAPAPRTESPTYVAGLGPHPLTGTGEMIRLALRRERVALLSWIVVVLLVATSTVAAIKQLYPDQAAREQLAKGIAANPAFLVITGPINDTSVGGVSAWRMGVIGSALVALMALFTVIRRTRADEEAGRTELVAAGVLGRAAPLTAAVTVAWAASLIIGAGIWLTWWAQGQDPLGALAFGLAVAGPGLVFAGVAAIAAQLVENARAATGIAGAMVGVAYGLRAVGDVAGVAWLPWISPLGWVGKVEAFGANRWWVLLLFPVTGAAAIGTALFLLGRRDVGLALWPTRPGPATNPALSSPLTLAARLQRGSLLGWSVGFLALGAATGSIADSADSLLADSPQLQEYMARLGGTEFLAKAILATDGGIAGLLAAVYAIGAVLRLAGEEDAGRAAPVLATAVSRIRWAAGHLLFAFAGSTVLLAVCGVITGLLHGAKSDPFGPAFADGLASALATAPAAWVLAGVAVLLFGVLRRWTVLAWAAVTAAFLLGQLGPLFELPQWVMDLSPFSHVGQVPAEPVNWTATLILTLVAAALVALGLAGFQRRDVVDG